MSGNNNRDDGGGDSKPLLFFVALGFGVVFINLWIIVGVKYCFRYNQRARQNVVDNENGDSIDLPNMGRPRRRREKKLMTMDEVNERFPLVKYKIWRATREQEGLPAEGGVTAPGSRAGSIKDGTTQRTSGDTDFVDGVSRENTKVHESHKRSDHAELPPSSEMKDFAAGSTDPVANTIDFRGKEETSAGSNSGEPMLVRPQQPSNLQVDDDDDDEDDPIRTAVPAELLQQPGDACAICIDTIEDDDEVRGLSCGHAFHAGCLDPWLTSRRACCPLCKADFYIPKPRSEGDTIETTQPQRHQLTPPQNVWVGGRRGVTFRPRIFFGGSRFALDHRDRLEQPYPVRENASAPRDEPGGHTQAGNNASLTDGSQLSVRNQSVSARLANQLRGGAFWMRLMRRQPTDHTEASVAAPSERQMSPGQLEEGTRT